MLLSDKIDELLPLVNYDLNSWVRETLVYPYDFIKAVEYALRRIGEQNRIMERTFFLPTVSEKRLYSLSLSELSSAKVDFLKLLDIGIVTFGTDGLQTTGKINEQWFENIETNRFVDYYELCKFVFGEKTYIKSNAITDSQVLGKYDLITNINTTTIKIGTFSNATLDYYIINLDQANFGSYSYRKITALSNPDITIDSETDWVVGDKVYISIGLPPMIALVSQVVIQLGYFGDDETKTIPCPANILTWLNHFCVKYLYDIMITRDKKQAEVYAAKLKVGTVKTEDSALYEIKKIINASAGSIVKKSYNPFKNTIYGR